MAPTIAIFPAAGALGSSTINHLLHTCHTPGASLILVSRNPSKVPQDWISSGVTLRQASYESTTSELQAVFSGADALFLLSYPDYNIDYRVKVHAKALEAARTAGVRHVFYSSLAFAGLHAHASKAGVMQAHLATEARLHDLAVDHVDFTFTTLREGIYSSSWPMYTSFPDLAAGRPLVKQPGSGTKAGIAWIKRDELGEGTARIIQAWAEGSTVFKNQIVLLTGPKAWTVQATIQALEKATGKKFTHEQASVSEYIALEQVRKVLGTDEDRLKLWATSLDAVEDGECAVVNPLLAQLLGREPEAFETTLKALLEEQQQPYQHAQSSG